MPFTIKTDNPKLIAPKGMWNVVQIEIKVDRSREEGVDVIGLGESTKTPVLRAPRLCDANKLANSLNMERKSKEEHPWGIFDDRGVYILPSW